MTRVVVIQPYVPRYRRDFFTALQRSLRDHDIELQVVSGSGPSQRSDNEQMPGQLIVRDWLGPLTGERLRLRAARLGRADLVVVEHAIKNLDSYPLLLRQRWGGRPVAMWGHGSTQGHHRGRLLTGAKASLTRQADWFFAYTHSGAQSVGSIGFPADRITVVQNSINTTRLREDLARITTDQVASFQSALRVTPGRVGLFLGRLEREKGIDYLASVADRMSSIDPDFTLLVGGAGPEDRTLASRPNVRMIGRVDEYSKALALRTADLLLIPQWIGLVAVDSLVSGVPIVAVADNRHMPESDYLTADRTTVTLPKGTPPGEFAERVSALLDQPERIARMSAHCVEDSGAVSLEAMVGNFCQGLLAWRSSSQRGTARGGRSRGWR